MRACGSGRDREGPLPPCGSGLDREERRHGFRYVSAALSWAWNPGCASHGASLFLVWPRKSNQKEGHPSIRPFAARRVPSLHRHSRGTLRRAIHGPAQLSRHPCRSTPSTATTFGLLRGTWVRVACEFPRDSRGESLCRLSRAEPLMVPTPCVLPRGSTKQSVDVANYNAPRPVPFAQAFRQHQTPLSEGRMESAWRGVSGMDAARGLGVPAYKGHGWPLYAGPRNVDEMREVSRSETRMQGQDFLVPFGATAKRDSPSRAKPMHLPITAIGCIPRSQRPKASPAETRHPPPRLRIRCTNAAPSLLHPAAARRDTYEENSLACA